MDNENSKRTGVISRRDFIIAAAATAAAALTGITPVNKAGATTLPENREDAAEHRLVSGWCIPH
ncbi:MAG TPA: twin-arginine translocation signal domain-containing protein [bacterium]|nr:twin-arginine translocation signal domain-containing protein [bacterium]